MITREQVDLDIAEKITDKTVSDKVSNIDDGANRNLILDYVDQQTIAKTIKVSLTSPQILNLFSTPLTIIPAVAGKVLIVRQIFQKYTHVSTAYTSNTWRIGFGSPNFGFTSFGPAITSADNSESLNPIAPTSGTSGGTFVNSPLVLGCITSDPIDGDGTLDLYVTYFEITI